MLKLKSSESRLCERLVSLRKRDIYSSRRNSDGVRVLPFGSKTTRSTVLQTASMKPSTKRPMTNLMLKQLPVVLKSHKSKPLRIMMRKVKTEATLSTTTSLTTCIELQGTLTTLKSWRNSVAAVLAQSTRLAIASTVTSTLSRKSNSPTDPRRTRGSCGRSRT